jgi:DNA-binding NarL/FixJ family response regulator
VKVLLAGDHAMFREGLAGMLGSAYGDQVEVVGKTKIGEEAVALAREKEPDVIVMEVDRTLEKARDALERMREGSESEASPPKVVILTMFDDPRMVGGIMGLGANALIHKSASVEDLFAALSTIALDGQEENLVVAMPQGALELSEDVLEKDGPRSVLSERELEILLLVARGMNNRQIASQLHIAEGTVKRHLSNIYPKMGVGSRGEALRMALENEWFTIPEIEATIDDA